MLPEYTREELAAGLDEVAADLLGEAGVARAAGRCLCCGRPFGNRSGVG